MGVERTTSMKKIALMVPLLHQGGFERVCVNTARMLEHDYDVTILIFDNKNIAYNIDGLNIVNIDVPSRSGKLRKVINVLKRTIAIRKIKKKEQFDVVYSFGPTANIVNLFSKGKERIWVGIRCHTDMDNHILLKLCAKKTEKIVCCTKILQDEIERDYHAKNVVTLYNSYDVEKIRKTAEEPIDIPEQYRGKRLLISVGRADDIKGFWHLIKAFSIVNEKLPDTVLTLVGAGNFEPYEKLAKELHVDQNVWFAGLQKNPFSYVKASTLYVLSSVAEGFPNALVEAMAIGKPVIANDCLTGPVEILTDDFKQYFGTKETVMAPYGILTTRLDAKKDMDARHITDEEINFAEEIIKFLSDEELMKKYSALSLERAQYFSDEQYKNTLYEWIDEDDVNRRKE